MALQHGGKREMSYGEALKQLNPCSPQVVVDLLSDILHGKARIIDVGCGRGVTLERLAKSTAYELYGAEPDAELLAVARLACPDKAIVHAGGEKLPFEDSFFDAVLMECVFSLVENPATVARELARVTQRAGYLLLTDIYTQSGDELCFGQVPEGHLPEEHLLADHQYMVPDAIGAISGFSATNSIFRYIYTISSMEALFIENGFSLEKFVDCTQDMRSMFAQMVMDGSADDYMDAGARERLRKAKAGYGIWIYRKV